MTKGEFQGEAEGINGGGRWNDAAEAGGNALCWEGDMSRRQMSTVTLSV